MFAKLAAFGAAFALVACVAVSADSDRDYGYEPEGYKPESYKPPAKDCRTTPPHTEAPKYTTEYKPKPKYYTEAPKYSTEYKPQPKYYTEAPKYTTENNSEPKHYTEAPKYTETPECTDAYKPPHKYCGKCGSTCRFTFCGKPYKVFEIGLYNDKAFTPAICDKYSKIIVGSVDETAEAYVVYGKHKVLISKYYPMGLKQHFSPSFFKSYYLGYSRSGVGHETPQQNQLQFLDNKCIVLPLSAYQVLDKYGNVVDEVHPKYNPFYDCVAFQTKISKDYY